MPRKEEAESGVDKKVDAKPAQKDAEPKTTEKSSPPWPLITIAAFASVMAVAFGIIMLIALGAYHSQKQGLGHENFGGRDGNGSWNYRHGGDDFNHNRVYVDAIRGVVTSVDGDTLIVSGGGRQVTVKRSAETVIHGDKEDIGVNDTVVVIGTKEDDGSYTAKVIVIRNGDESVNRMPVERSPGV